MAQHPLHKVCAHIDLDAFYAQVRGIRKQYPAEPQRSSTQGRPTGPCRRPTWFRRCCSPACRPACLPASRPACLPGLQVEARQHPELQGKPVGVVQYNPYGDLETRGADENRVMNASNGSLIAVRCVVAWCPPAAPRVVCCLCSTAPEPAPWAGMLCAYSHNTPCLPPQLRGARQRRQAQHAGGPGPRRLPRHPACAGKQACCCRCWYCH